MSDDTPALSATVAVIPQNQMAALACAPALATSSPANSFIANHSSPVSMASSLSDNTAMAVAMTTAMYKRRVTWTPELEERFSRVVIKHGVKSATPRLILNEMAVEGLTRENVASHLQKFRKRVIKAFGITRAELQDTHGARFLQAGGHVAAAPSKAPKDTAKPTPSMPSYPVMARRALIQQKVPELNFVRLPKPCVTDPDLPHNLPLFLL
ncbi:Myb-like DNA-binding domain [Carpediemonas membranifera]|uniref:Myb-like DNA-binding domain n=1 Tax=Carpediemonas membranifera TaxID=201153 RepID=A0A8J6AZE7_9EUKA|nr:Myb-like DNA-binding domain [Carpediemonas membranifera]|eukprot:KAG9389654.1 Myb-like DNA-binding domain [Carpediemonas membranifera]